MGTNTESPLGLLMKVDPKVLKKLHQIADYDMSRQRASYLRDLELKGQTDLKAVPVALIERELKRFLSLPILFPDTGRQFVPPRAVDDFWHKFILDTPAYRSFVTPFTDTTSIM